MILHPLTRILEIIAKYINPPSNCIQKYDTSLQDMQVQSLDFIFIKLKI